MYIVGGSGVSDANGDPRIHDHPPGGRFVSRYTQTLQFGCIVTRKSRISMIVCHDTGEWRILFVPSLLKLHQQHCCEAGQKGNEAVYELCPKEALLAFGQKRYAGMTVL
jgi:hypothetical protein